MIRAGIEEAGETIGQTIANFLAPIWHYLLIGLAALVVVIVLLCLCQRTNCCSTTTSKSLAFTTIIHPNKDQVRRDAWELVSSNPTDCGDDLPPPAYQKNTKLKGAVDTATRTPLLYPNPDQIIHVGPVDKQ